jgi:hypothetical protein
LLHAGCFTLISSPQSLDLLHARANNDASPSHAT